MTPTYEPPANYYEIAGPRLIAPGTLRYSVRRVINGITHATTATCRSRWSAARMATTIRNRDAKTNPDRATWPIIETE